MKRLVISTGPDPMPAVKGAGFVQECGPERLEAKEELYRRISPAVSPECIVASSTSTILASELQKKCPFAPQLLIGHPFNPPHLLPLVEVIGGCQTDPEILQRTLAFYRKLGRAVIHLNMERPGHLANRLQAALWREAVDAVACGQATVADVDLAVRTSLGPRWAVMGPFESFNFGGGNGGLKHFMSHLGPAFERLWDDAHRPEMTKELTTKLCDALIDTTIDFGDEDRRAEVYARLSAVIAAAKRTDQEDVSSS